MKSPAKYMKPWQNENHNFYGLIKIDETVKSPNSVTPVKTGVQKLLR